ncbi:hypothetical protein [Streptococcus sp. zg-JUN1979]|uniref:hypothetical protein n=1 Tax=Streptococcus sp. zg-JUN1979 TaxID=3391450 RepID=UPI0039A77899
MVKNELLEKEINKTINEARADIPKPEKKKKPIFYKLIIILITIAVLFSLFRFLF